MFIQQREVGIHTSACGGVFDGLSLFLSVDCVLFLFVFVWPTAYFVFCKNFNKQSNEKSKYFDV